MLFSLKSIFAPDIVCEEKIFLKIVDITEIGMIGWSLLVKLRIRVWKALKIQSVTFRKKVLKSQEIPKLFWFICVSNIDYCNLEYVLYFL